MSDKSKIEWTDATWNPVRGCSRVSEGCRHCYAERMAARFSGPGLWADGLAENTPAGPRWTGRVQLVPGQLDQPLRWKAPRRIFVNSMSDLFHEGLSNEQIAAVFGVMAACPQHTFQVLTKRPERMRNWFGWMRVFAMAQRDIASAPTERQTTMKAAFTAMGETDAAKRRLDAHWWVDGDYGPWPLPNVWLGVSVEDQATADARIPLLLETPAAVRFVSAEPLLAPVDMRRGIYQMGPADGGFRDRGTSLAGIDWVIVGGESGPGARPMHPDWARGLRDQCAAAGVAFHFKQWGAWAPVGGHWRQGDTFVWPDGGTHRQTGGEFPASRDAATMRSASKGAAGRMLDGRTHDEFPDGCQA